MYLDTHPLSDKCFVRFFSQCVACLFKNLRIRVYDKMYIWGVMALMHWVKGSALSLQWLGSLLRRRFDHWPGNFHVPLVQPKGKKKSTIFEFPGSPVG